MKQLATTFGRRSSTVGKAFAKAMGPNENWSTIADFRGCKLWAGPGNKIERAILWTGENYDRINFELIDAVVRPGDVCLDVGANIGVYSMVLSAASGDCGNVHAFEPVDHIRRKLITNARLNGYSQLNIRDFALGESENTMEMYQVREGVFRGGTSSFVRNESVESMGDKSFHRKEVAIHTLDSYVQKRSLRRVDFMKIDVEGFEWNVIKGGESTIESLRPTILIEFDLVRHEPFREKMQEFFRSFEYSVFELKLVQNKVCFIPFDFRKNPKYRNLFCRP